MCHVCKKYLSSPAQLLKHVAKHGGSKVTCDQCGKQFGLTKMLNRHIMSVHDPDPVKGFRCLSAQCGVAFAELVQIRKHVAEVQK